MTAAVYVRARDGALYGDPVWLFPEGFVAFPAKAGPPEPFGELAIWLDPKGPKDQPVGFSVVDVLRRVMGFGLTPHGLPRASETPERFGYSRPLCSADLDSIACAERRELVIPGSDPEVKRAAAVFWFELVRRPPRPSVSTDRQRHAGRVRAATVIDLEGSPFDAHQFEIPE